MTALFAFLTGSMAMLCGGVSVFMWLHGHMWGVALNAVTCLWNLSAFIHHIGQMRRGGAQ